jgi:hypothetical protein
MARSLSRFLERPWTTGQAVLYGTLAVGVLDGLDAIVFFGLRGVAPTRIFQGIAAGVLGRSAAVGGGLSTALLGLFLHFVVACGIVTTYVIASRSFPSLARRPLLYGPIFGVVAFFVMNLIVIPLSAIGGPVRFTTPVLINGLLIHALAVGPASAIAAARAAVGVGSRDAEELASARLSSSSGGSSGHA